jgi:2-oxoglutarate dehydrogenase E2 component (dihydrolipoamide succinyltransferase)
MKIDVKVPAIGESITEATVGVWLKNNGEAVEEDEVICEIESEKATIEVVAEKAGVLSHKVKEGDQVSIGAIIAVIDTDASAEGTVKKENVADPAVNKDDTPGEIKKDKDKKSEVNSKISPVAANILQESGIDPAKITGSGTGGRIVKEDALKAVEEGSSKPKDEKSSPQQKTDDSPQVSKGTGERPERRVRMTTLRKTIARRLLEAKNGTAMLTTFNEVDLWKVKELRDRYKEMFKEKHGVGLGFMSFFTRACSLALVEIPAVNAMIDGDEIVYHDYADIGIAVSTDKGLVVPIIRDAQNMALHEIELEIIRLATIAREGKLSIDDMNGGTFTITNGGVFGSMLSTPIINIPQSAILGMHNITDRPVAVNGQVLIRPMMYVALSYDHRLVDGRESVTFLKRVKELLEDPARMILEV